MKAAIVASVLLAATAADAMCTGTPGFQTCTDSSGNSYSVQRNGGSTHMNGYNANTGSTWSQNSQTLGNTTFHSGHSNGNSWNGTTQNIGNMQIHNGMDSRGRPYSRTCQQIGSQTFCN
jgi:hypothetical protein